MFITQFGHYTVVLGIPRLRIHDVAVRFASNMVTFGSQYCITHCHDAPVMVQGLTEKPPEWVYSCSKRIIEPQIQPQHAFQGNINMLHGSSFLWTFKKGPLTIFNASLYDINWAIEAKDLQERPLEEIFPKEYHEFLRLFNKVLVDRLPPHCPAIDHEVHLNEVEMQTWGPLYSMSM